MSSTPAASLSSLRISLVFCLFCLSGCGYRWQNQTPLYTPGKTVSVPFVRGDQSGLLTSAIIAELASTGPWRYASSGADLQLSICFLGFHDENIGFRYDRGKRGNIKRSIVPTETRVFATVEIQLIDVVTGCVVCGPACVGAWYDFDHDYYSSRNGINIFSLGQLTDIESAREAALPPLYRNLARNILEYLRNCH